MTMQYISAIGAGSAAFEFTSIPSTYKDLMIIVTARSTSGYNGFDFYCTFNNETVTNYAFRWLYADSFTQLANGYDTGNNIGIGDSSQNMPSGNYGQMYVYIPNYANNGNYKSLYSKWFATQYSVNTPAWIGQTALLNRGTNPISSVKLYTSSGAFQDSSRATLYGIS